ICSICSVLFTSLFKIGISVPITLSKGNSVVKCVNKSVKATETSIVYTLLALCSLKRSIIEGLKYLLIICARTKNYIFNSYTYYLSHAISLPCLYFHIIFIM